MPTDRLEGRCAECIEHVLIWGVAYFRRNDDGSHWHYNPETMNQLTTADLTEGDMVSESAKTTLRAIKDRTRKPPWLKEGQ